MTPRNSIPEPARDIPVAADVDVCVVGGSCTGVFAAVAAARMGVSSAVVEANGFFGGVATAGLVNIWHSTRNTTSDRPIIAGLTTETIDRLDRRGAVLRRPHSPHAAYVLNTAELAVELDRLVTEADVRPFLHARFAAPAMAGDRVTAAIVEDKTGRRAIRAKYFVDATGDGDLISRAGLPFTLRRDLQPPTTCFHLYGFSAVQRAHDGAGISRLVFVPAHGGSFPRGFLWDSEVVGVPDLRMVAGPRVPHANCADADELTAAEIEGRRQAAAMVALLRSLPGGEGIRLAHLPACIGIRETRHATCLHELTETEVLTGTRFDDAIANGSYRVDVHHSDKPGLTFRYLDGREEYVAPGEPPQVGRWREQTEQDPTFYQIPYRALVPRGSRNVLVAGRLLSADRGAYGAVRVMVTCNQTGQAAGVAGALAMRAGCDVADVCPAALREALADQGALIL